MSIEAMKQALEATEVLKSLFRQAEARHVGLFPSPNVVCQITVEDLRKGLYAADTLRTSIEQAEKQEPVAWCVLEPWLSGKFEAQDCFSDVALDANVGWVPLYTTPQPQREWVGLTDEEIEALASWWPSYDQMPAIKVLIKDVTNSLKEKNT
jgi:hypothetical protein